jgi:hypothetical protein
LRHTSVPWNFSALSFNISLCGNPVATFSWDWLYRVLHKFVTLWGFCKVKPGFH